MRAFVCPKGAEVTGVCGTAHVDLVRSLGADTVLDYTRQRQLDPSARFDFVLDAVLTAPLGQASSEGPETRT